MISTPFSGGEQYVSPDYMTDEYKDIYRSELCVLDGDSNDVTEFIEFKGDTIATEPGQYTVTLAGTGNIQGSVEVTWEITKIDLSQLSMGSGYQNNLEIWFPLYVEQYHDYPEYEQGVFDGQYMTWEPQLDDNGNQTYEIRRFSDGARFKFNNLISKADIKIYLKSAYPFNAEWRDAYQQINQLYLNRSDNSGFQQECWFNGNTYTEDYIYEKYTYKLTEQDIWGTNDSKAAEIWSGIREGRYDQETIDRYMRYYGTFPDYIWLNMSTRIYNGEIDTADERSQLWDIMGTQWEGIGTQVWFRGISDYFDGEAWLNLEVLPIDIHELSVNMIRTDIPQNEFGENCTVFECIPYGDIPYEYLWFTFQYNGYNIGDVYFNGAEEVKNDEGHYFEWHFNNNDNYVIQEVYRLTDNNMETVDGYTAAEYTTYRLLVQFGNYYGTTMGHAYIDITTGDANAISVEQPYLGEFEYTGNNICPAVVVTSNGEVIDEPYYQVDWDNNKNVGTATGTVKASGKYGGTVEVTFDIIPAKLEDFTFTDYDSTGPWECVYLGREQYIGSKYATLTKKGSPNCIADVTVDCSGTDVGVYVGTITGNGNIVGTREIQLTINPINLEHCYVFCPLYKCIECGMYLSDGRDGCDNCVPEAVTYKGKPEYRLLTYLDTRRMLDRDAENIRDNPSHYIRDAWSIDENTGDYARVLGYYSRTTRSECLGTAGVLQFQNNVPYEWVHEGLRIVYLPIWKTGYRELNNENYDNCHDGYTREYEITGGYAGDTLDEYGLDIMELGNGYEITNIDQIINWGYELKYDDYTVCTSYYSDQTTGDISDIGDEGSLEGYVEINMSELFNSSDTDCIGSLYDLYPIWGDGTNANIEFGWTESTNIFILRGNKNDNVVGNIGTCIIMLPLDVNELDISVQNAVYQADIYDGLYNYYTSPIQIEYNGYNCGYLRTYQSRREDDIGYSYSLNVPNTYGGSGYTWGSSYTDPLDSTKTIETVSYPLLYTEYITDAGTHNISIYGGGLFVDVGSLERQSMFFCGHREVPITIEQRDLSDEKDNVKAQSTQWTGSEVITQIDVYDPLNYGRKQGDWYFTTDSEIGIHRDENYNITSVWTMQEWRDWWATVRWEGTKVPNN